MSEFVVENTYYGRGEATNRWWGFLGLGDEIDCKNVNEEGW